MIVFAIILFAIILASVLIGVAATRVVAQLPLADGGSLVFNAAGAHFVCGGDEALADSYAKVIAEFKGSNAQELVEQLDAAWAAHYIAIDEAGVI